MLTGAIVSLGLPTLFDGHPDQGEAAFGVYGLVINHVSIFNMVVVGGTLQAVSKLVSESPGHARRTLNSALRLQLVVGVPIAALYVLSAPWVAGQLNDPALTPYIRVSGAIVLMYCFYAVFVGYFNGLKRFTGQAMLDIGFASTKTVLLVGAVLAGFGVMGAIVGFAATAVVMTVVAGVWVVRLGRGSPADQGAPGDSRVGRLAAFMLSIMLYTFLLNAILRADLFLLKAFAAADGGDAATQLSNRLVGVYTAVVNVARLPYQAVIAITFVAFPLISRATFDGDRVTARGYIEQTARSSLLLAAGMVAVLLAQRQPVLAALYPQGYSAGGDPLLWLAVAMLAFSMLFVATTVLVGAGRPMWASGVGLFTLVASVGCNVGLLSGLEPGEHMLERAAVATTIATVAGLVVAFGVLYRLFGARPPWRTGVRVAMAAGLVIGLGLFLGDWPVQPASRLVGLGVVGGKMALLAVLFYALLYLLREFTGEDRERLARVLRRRRVKED